MWALLVAMRQFSLCLIDIVSQIFIPQRRLLKEKLIESGGGKKKDVLVVPQHLVVHQHLVVQQHQQSLVPFKQDETVLLVGEGDFSFSVSIVQQGMIKPDNLIATSYDSKVQAEAKYPKAKAHLDILAAKGAWIVHEVDATDLLTSLNLVSKGKSHLLKHKQNLNFIMFNFPHTGKMYKKHSDRTLDHRLLIWLYFKRCKEVFAYMNNRALDSPNHGKIVLTLFESEPYISWQVVSLAREVGLCVERSGKFVWAMFPEYNHRCTNTTSCTAKPARSRDARMYVLAPKK